MASPKQSTLEEEVELGERLGRGRFGEVFKGVWKEAQQSCAVKVLKKRGSSDKKSIAREVDILRKVKGHPNVLGLLDWFETPKEYIIITELIPGGELFDYLIEKDYLSERDAASYVHEMLKGLNHLHQGKICHLDLKPENIMLMDAEHHRIKLVDFGCARDLECEGEVSVMGGTAEFVAPEVINYDPVSLSADMWGIGVITYVMLSGISPFLGDTDQETYCNVISAEYEYDEEFPQVSQSAKDFIDALLQAPPKKRLTVEKSLDHAWLQMSDSDNVIKTDKLKSFRARRKLKAALHTVRVSCSMAKLIASRSQCKLSLQEDPVLDNTH